MSKKTGSFSVLGLLFGDSLDELASPLVISMSIGLIVLKLSTFMMLELCKWTEAFYTLCESVVKVVKYLYAQYLAYIGYKIIPIDAVLPPAKAQISSKTDMSLKTKSESGKTEERIQIITVKK